LSDDDEQVSDREQQMRAKFIKFMIHSAILLPFLLIMASLAAGSTALQFDCNFRRGGWGGYLEDNDYRCEAKNLNITTRDVIIDGVLRNNPNGNKNVKALDIDWQICHFIPKGIENIFGDLIMIQIFNSH